LRNLPRGPNGQKRSWYSRRATRSNCQSMQFAMGHCAMSYQLQNPDSHSLNTNSAPRTGRQGINLASPSWLPIRSTPGTWVTQRLPGPRATGAVRARTSGPDATVADLSHLHAHRPTKVSPSVAEMQLSAHVMIPKRAQADSGRSALVLRSDKRLKGGVPPASTYRKAGNPWRPGPAFYSQEQAQPISARSSAQT
jgi:hypothetical protein